MSSHDDARDPTVRPVAESPAAPARRIRPERWVMGFVVAVIVFLVVGAILSYLLMIATQDARFSWVTRDLFLGFEFTNEHNIPTWVSSMKWAALGIIALAMAAASHRFRLSLLFLGLVGLYASLDEYAMLHERLGIIGNQFLPDWVSNYTAAWVIPGLILAAIVVAILLRLVLNLPRRARNGIFLGGAVFLLGAVGMESVWWVMTSGADPEQITGWAIIVSAIEECLEILGVGIAIAALASTMDVRVDGERLRIDILRDTAGDPAAH